jgi:hypothetical protein
MVDVTYIKWRTVLDVEFWRRMGLPVFFYLVTQGVSPIDEVRYVERLVEGGGGATRHLPHHLDF